MLIYFLIIILLSSLTYVNRPLICMFYVTRLVGHQSRCCEEQGIFFTFSSNPRWWW